MNTNELPLTGKRISAASFAKLLGKDRAFVLKLWKAQEITAVDERAPGAASPRLTFDPMDAVRWRSRRMVVPGEKDEQQQAVQVEPATGVVERRLRKLAAKRARRAS